MQTTLDEINVPAFTAVHADPNRTRDLYTMVPNSCRSIEVVLAYYADATSMTSTESNRSHSREMALACMVSPRIMNLVTLALIYNRNRRKRAVVPLIAKGLRRCTQKSTPFANSTYQQQADRRVPSSSCVLRGWFAARFEFTSCRPPRGVLA